MTVNDKLDEIEARAILATDGPWAFGVAPAEGSDETKAEYLARALTDEGPLYALFVPATVGQPGGYLVPAVTGDGPNAGNNAEFIAAARQDVPALVNALRAVLALADEMDQNGGAGLAAAVRDAIEENLR